MREFSKKINFLWLCVPLLFSACFGPADVKDLEASLQKELVKKESVKKESSEIPFPTLLDEKLYTPEQVCEDAHLQNSTVAFALVLLKTHLCDFGTGVCATSLLSIADPDNQWIQKNFQTYHSRFFIYTLEGNTVWQHKSIKMANLIEEAWGKGDVNPEVAVVDLSRPCDADDLVIGRDYLMNYPNAFSLKRKQRASALGELVYSLLRRRYSSTELEIKGIETPEYRDDLFAETDFDQDLGKALKKIDLQTEKSIARKAFTIDFRQKNYTITDREKERINKKHFSAFYFHLMSHLQLKK
ncbi:MAG: hypothetical protein CL678_18780 [Bdellovibrionaceae bacterium]|nr:hypothetical protein [Pseudobdellovibrionaceae bacterium]|tara:strand:+ start:7171 stop:8067 length:897 start_codon:yes stop_codon:yes gene_type:complete